MNFNNIHNQLNSLNYQIGKKPSEFIEKKLNELTVKTNKHRELGLHWRSVNTNLSLHLLNYNVAPQAQLSLETCKEALKNGYKPCFKASEA